MTPPRHPLTRTIARHRCVIAHLQQATPRCPLTLAEYEQEVVALEAALAIEAAIHEAGADGDHASIASLGLRVSPVGAIAVIPKDKAT